MAIKAEELNVILTARDKEFQRKMKAAERRVEYFKKRSNQNLSSASKNFDMLSSAAKRFLPALGAGIIVAQVRRITTEMDEIGKKADQIGITTDALQELRFVAEGAGVSQSAFTSSLERFSKRLGEAEMGMGAAKRALEEMGLEASDLTKIPLEDALKIIADEMQSIESPTERAAQAAALFGREGVAMVNMLREGGDALGEMQRAAKEAGAVIDKDLIRNAEEAQTKLDAASRVINAQLSVALAELIPLLVTGAEGFAALVKNVVGAIQAVENFVDPQTDLEIATDNVVAAMGDEIRQSQQLDIALGRSTSMSAEAARQKLEEAMARQENAKAAINEQKAIALGSDAYQSLINQIEASQDAAMSISAAPDTLVSPSKIAAYEAAQQRLVELRTEQARMLTTDQELTDQFERTTANIAELEDALVNASNGMVTFGEDMANPIDASDRLSSSASSASASTDELLANLATASPALQQLGFNAQFLESAMQGVESSMESAFMSMVDGTQTASEAFKGMATEIIKELYRIFVVKQIVGLVSGFIGDPSMFGGMGGTSPVNGSIRPIARASGGTVQAGRSYMTGESGRELFVPKTDGRILSPAQTSNMGGSNSVVVNQTINVSTGVQQTVRTEIKTLMPQIANAAKAAVADAKLRGGSYGRSFA